MKTAILIPARYQSSRYPGKMLAEVNGKPLIRHVFDICNQTDHHVMVLTDHEDIAKQVPNFVMTGEADNGTERCCDAMQGMGFSQYVNVQGDMPDITPAMIEKCIEHLSKYSVTTLYTTMPKEKQNDPNTVKMIRAKDQALWFGRGMTGYGDWHLGIYGYTATALRMYKKLEIPDEEHIEKLEQLRWLKNGWQIGCLNVNFNGVEINTPEDLKEWHNKNSH
mgnify:FL=1|tara:strand:+ start:1288 stop:1950 length:663 start_codon:yes stop_codon:yes gene_type:complete